ncbi:malonate decarboxylase holo-ACP synthase [Acidicapsa ligni]|uniref:malonate decarboxylase holo-ACP synthase n=1 Tax=Acidicapsa ligni TaxID=542300 RepID=UPI0021E021CF|nr:malonate decarboxylase holo-ACP synthase [Acidicapsa ligni]
MISIAQHSLRVHDLLLLRSGVVISADGSKPAWVTSFESGDLWVVVRRATAPSGFVAVGIRGVHRNQRWGGFAALADVKERLHPSQLSFRMAHRTRIAIPALATLSWLEGQLERSALDWGPVGSVGFELATGQQVVTGTSDLDIALFAPTRFTKDAARDLWSIMRSAPGKIDVRVETLCCGFSLEEYAREETGQVLVRLPESQKFAIDPWSVSVMKD